MVEYEPAHGMVGYVETNIRNQPSLYFVNYYLLLFAAAFIILR